MSAILSGVNHPQIKHSSVENRSDFHHFNVAGRTGSFINMPDDIFVFGAPYNKILPTFSPGRHTHTAGQRCVQVYSGCTRVYSVRYRALPVIWWAGWWLASKKTGMCNVCPGRSTGSLLECELRAGGRFLLSCPRTWLVVGW